MISRKEYFLRRRRQLRSTSPIDLNRFRKTLQIANRRIQKARRQLNDRMSNNNGAPDGSISDGNDGGGQGEGSHNDGGNAGGGATTGSRSLTVVNDISLAPAPFYGLPGEDATQWAQTFQRYYTFRGLGARQAANLFPLMLRDIALTWFNEKFPVPPTTIEPVLQQFRERFGLSDAAKWRFRGELWRRKQQTTESVDAYFQDMQRRATRLGLEQTELRDAIVQGLRSEIRTFVLQREAKTIADVYKAAQLAESTIDPVTSTMAGHLEKSLELMKRLEDRLSRTTVAETEQGGATGGRPRSANYSADHQPRGRGYYKRYDSPRNGPRRDVRTRFSPNRSPSPVTRSSSEQWNQPGNNGGRARGNMRNNGGKCFNCLLSHGAGRCPAKNVKCYLCQKYGHYQRVHINPDAKRQE